MLLSLSLVSASGVASTYFGGNPLTMAAGDTKVVDLNLQNMVGNDDVTFKVVVTQGSDIASLSEDTYLVRAGTSDTMAPVRISLPGDATGSYPVTVEFKTVTASEGGGVTMGTGMTISFDVVVAGKVFPTTTLVIIIVAIILVIIVAWLLLRKKRK